MGRELKRVAPGADWQRKERGAPLLDENPLFTPGTWFQMWQTVSDKPYTPAFETAEELARWCADHPWGMEVDSPVPYETWLRFINGPGWAPSMVDNGAGPVIGVCAA
jgi:hypothetical protein